MANKRVNPQLPSGTVPMTVSQQVPLAQPALVDPATQRFDTSALAKGLEHFSKKTAQRKSEMQEEALLKGREFVRQNPEVFAAAKTDEELERALRNAVRDGAIPRGLLPSFQDGIRKSVAENRLKDAQAQVQEAVLRYSGIDEETGEPKDLSTVQREIGAISDQIISRVPQSLLTDPAFGERVEQLTRQIGDGARQEAFLKALSDRNDWAIKDAQESFQGALDDVEGPLSTQEQEGLTAILDGLVTKYKNRGVDDVEVALVGAAINHAKRLRQDSVDDALHFLEEVGKFKVQGQALGLDEQMTAYQAALEEEFEKAESREVVRNNRDLTRVQDILIEADGDLLSLRENGDFEGYEAGLRAAISEFPVRPGIDGRVERAIQRQVEIAKNEGQDTDSDMLRLVSLMENGQANVPDDWVEVYGTRLGPDLFNRMAKAYANQDRVKSSKEVNDRKVDRAVAASRDVVLTSGLGLSARSKFNDRVASFEEDMRQRVDQRRAALAAQGLSLTEIDAEMEPYIDNAIQAFQTNTDKVAAEIRNLDRQRADVYSLLTVPTGDRIGQAIERLDEIRSSFPPEVVDQIDRRIQQAQQELTLANQSLVQSSDNPIYQSITDLTSILSDEEGNKDPVVSKAEQSVFTEAAEDKDAFIQSIFDKYGVVNEQTIKAELTERVTDRIGSGEDGSLSDVVLQESAYRDLYRQIGSTWTSTGAAEVFLKSQQEIGDRAFRLGRTLSNQRSSLDVERVFRDPELSEEEKEVLAAAFVATPTDVINGSVILSSFTGDWSTKISLENIDWRSTPMGSSLRGVLEGMPSDIDDRGAFLQQIGYLQDGVFIEEDVYAASERFLNDQAVLVKIRR